ncbi:MAG TPA: hypothetical protein VFI84_00485 [Candidatus Saccharimonadales bacterium]|nr:hypothetical protein [Candidatus Saccharimonadales bacterium]
MAETHTPATLVFTEEILNRSYAEVSTGLDAARAEEIGHLKSRDMALAALFGDILGNSSAMYGPEMSKCSAAGFVMAARAVRYASGDIVMPPHADTDVKIYYSQVTKHPQKLAADFGEIYADQTTVLDLASNRLSNDLSRFAAKLVFTLNGLAMGSEQPMYRISQLVPAIPLQRTAHQRVSATRELRKNRARFGLNS